ncbi:MAG: hypothetical protein V5A61_09570 [Haloarculaceae archaeon]
MTDGAGGGSPPEKPGSVPDDREPYTPVEVAFARDGTPVFGFETDPSRAGEPLAFEFVLLSDGTVRFGVRVGTRLTVVARERSARRVAERLVEYESYDVAVSYGDRTQSPETDDRYDEVTRHRLDDRAYDRLYEAYLRLGERGR